MKLKNILKSYLFVIIGSLMIAAGYNMFFIPCKISSGGINSIGTVLLYKFRIPVSLTNIFFNAVLFVFGYKYVGRNSVIRTIVGIVTLSVFLEMTKALSDFESDIFIASVMGGALVGMGVGFVVRAEASTGGSDFAGIILKKFFQHIPVATLILLIDSVIIVIAGIAFDSYMITFYSAVSMFVASKVTDSVMTFGDAAKSVYIISSRNEDIAKMIIEYVNRGVTGIYSKGLYKGNNGIMLLCVVRPKQLPRLVNKVKEIDKNAFIIVNEVKEVLGEGFKKE